MSDVIFARTRWHYEPYDDWFKLAELSGFSMCFVDEIPKCGVKDKVYIVSPVNGEWKQGIETDARIILWHIEYGFDKPNIPGVSEVWASDSWYAKTLGAKHVLMGSHPALNLRPNDRHIRRYDVAWLAYTPPRRETILTWMREAGLTVAPNGWGQERHAILSQSACMVAVHQLEDFHCMPPLRLALCAAYHLPYITETPFEISPFTHEQVITAGYGSLADTVAYWTRRMPEQDLQAYGEALFEYLCIDHSFRREVERAL